MSYFKAVVLARFDKDGDGKLDDAEAQALKSVLDAVQLPPDEFRSLDSQTRILVDEVVAAQWIEDNGKDLFARQEIAKTVPANEWKFSF